MFSTCSHLQTVGLPIDEVKTSIMVPGLCGQEPASERHQGKDQSSLQQQVQLCEHTPEPVDAVCKWTTLFCKCEQLERAE